MRGVKKKFLDTPHMSFYVINSKKDAVIAVLASFCATYRKDDKVFLFYAPQTD